MMQQYFAAKEAHPGTLMAMRVGDFYEFYGEDAETAAACLEITLTGREDASNGRIAMAGVPYHSVDKYIARLIASGHKVALCDQVEDPKSAKGLVRRAVTRVLTPGTVVEDSMLSSGANSFLAAVCMVEGRCGLAVLDPSTGEFLATDLEGEQQLDQLMQELARLRPSELLFAEALQEIAAAAETALGAAGTLHQPTGADRAERQLMKHFEVSNLRGFGFEEPTAAVVAASMVLDYATKNGLSLAHVDAIASYSVDSFMPLDSATRRSLELTQNLIDGTRQYTLLAVLDWTCTPMGARLIKRWIEQPLLDIKALKARHDSVEAFLRSALVRADVRDALRNVRDVERLVSRCAMGVASPRDLAALRFSLGKLPDLEETVRKVASPRMHELLKAVGDHRELALHLKRALLPDPPMTLKDGGVIAEGYDAELDKLRELGKEGRSYIAALEASEREKTGIANLKVGYNAVFGYYLEVQKSQIEKVPEHYIRKQTTANAERYITAELKDHESAVLGAGEKAQRLESELFAQVRQAVAARSKELLATARAIAEIDVLGSFAESAAVRNLAKPQLVEGDCLEYTDGRHPIVEAYGTQFVPNDLNLGDGAEATRLIVLTGPNMSGKSTYLRQTALMVLMAQIGSYVPASEARFGVCDRVFARIGAKDELALGQSTFMVEMVESANILHHATRQSLVIVDEVGRGTSTFDGLAIAWALTERLAEIGAKAMFATHYHQLNVLADQLPTVANFCVAVQEVGDQVIWTHRVVPGGTDKSYGLQVARMAGMPPAVIDRATQILMQLEHSEQMPRAVSQIVKTVQMTLFEAEEPPIVRELALVDVDRLTPVQAIQILDDWKARFGAK